MKTVISPTPAVRSKSFTKGFTLLELVIVVIIMGLVYSMVTLSTPQATATLPKLSASNLADFLRSVNPKEHQSFYLYGEQCQRIAFEPALDESVAVDTIDFSSDTQAFWFDNYGTMQALSFAPKKDDHFTTKVCLKFEKFANGSTTPMIIQSGKTFYYHAFFEGVQSFETALQAATWIKQTLNNPKNLDLY